MGTLGQYLRDSRTARGLDLRDAAQQTRISVQYLKALEEEDFARLPGEVFVRGFLKNYGKFLRLNEAELMKRYDALRQKPSAPGAAVHAEAPVEAEEGPRHEKIPLEPFFWGAGIFVVLVLLLFVALPERQPKRDGGEAAVSPAVVSELSSTAVTTIPPEKLYLEVTALEDTWLLVRTDDGPQKKALLKKGENLIWSADERFSLSFGSAGAIRLLLNGQELTLNEPRNAVIRDLIVTAAGIMDRTIQPAASALPKRRPSAEPPAAAPLRDPQHLPPPPLPQKRELPPIVPQPLQQPAGAPAPLLQKRAPQPSAPPVTRPSATPASAPPVTRLSATPASAPPVTRPSATPAREQQRPPEPGPQASVVKPAAEKPLVEKQPAPPLEPPRSTSATGTVDQAPADRTVR